MDNERLKDLVEELDAGGRDERQGELGRVRRIWMSTE